MTFATQLPLDHDHTWRVHLSREWDALGPFPIHAREQHFLSPSFPVNLSIPIDYDRKWPSSYVDGGEVSWSRFQSAEDGELRVSYPQVRWTTLRSNEGWAALQHHSVLRASITILPPAGMESTSPPRLQVQLVQGSFFCIMPMCQYHPKAQGDDSRTLVPRWYSGNIYNLQHAPPQIVDLPIPPSSTSPTEYDIFVSGDYEIRLFGDPRTYSQNDVPVLNINVAVEILQPVQKLVRDESQDVTCDFVDGFAVGDAFGLGLRSIDGWWTVTEAALRDNHIDGISLHLLQDMVLAPTQTRIVPVQILQIKPIKSNELLLDITAACNGYSITINVAIPITHHANWHVSNTAIKASYFFARSMATSFLVHSPIHPNDGKPKPPILALHGAGVNILDQSFWSKSLHRQKHSWVVMPIGRTSWGLDWHGPSARDAFSSVDALASILNRHVPWHQWKFDAGCPVLLLGHSNGGQGSWYIAARFPDRVVAVVPAAGYIKSQSYVPLTMSRSKRFIDPFLGAILDTALTPDDDDLFLSNLVDTPILALHGGDDDNVPPWHSREAISVLKQWNPGAIAIYREIPDQPHWWPSVFDNNRVQLFIDSVIYGVARPRSTQFTLTVAIPVESGSLHGWTIERVRIPGRLARLHVSEQDGSITASTANVHTFSIDLDIYPMDEIVVNGYRQRVPHEVSSRIWRPKLWPDQRQDKFELQPSGRMQLILGSLAPLILVIPDENRTQELSVALRIAHDLHKFHRIDSEVVLSSEALESVLGSAMGEGNLVIIGDVDDASLARWCFSRQESVFKISSNPPTLNGQMLDEDSGIMFLHPHPQNPQGNIAFIMGDQSGIERVARLFPIRTGVSVPDWIVICSKADDIGAAGLTGAGVWAMNWKWDDAANWCH